MRSNPRCDSRNVLRDGGRRRGQRRRLDRRNRRRASGEPALDAAAEHGDNSDHENGDEGDQQPVLRYGNGSLFGEKAGCCCSNPAHLFVRGQGGHSITPGTNKRHIGHPVRRAVHPLGSGCRLFRSGVKFALRAAGVTRGIAVSDLARTDFS